jgi:hypothetical protein
MKRLFGDGVFPAGLRLVDTRTSITGVVISTDRPAGAIKHGSFALDRPAAAEAERLRSPGTGEPCPAARCRQQSGASSLGTPRCSPWSP